LAAPPKPAPCAVYKINTAAGAVKPRRFTGSSNIPLWDHCVLLYALLVIK
jgi:hypothetical protein